MTKPDAAILFTPSLLRETARIGGELADIIERSRDLRWWAHQLHSRAASAWRRAIRGASDGEASQLLAIITEASLCQRCLSYRLGVSTAHVEILLKIIPDSVGVAMASRACTGCLQTRTTYRVEGPRCRTTPGAILDFLSQHPASAYCTACISAMLFGGKNIDVAMRLVEGHGIHRGHDRCTACRKSRLVARLPAASKVLEGDGLIRRDAATG